MFVDYVKMLNPLDRMLYWIKERHNIYLRKKANLSKPWTDDEVLQNYFFTNPYRENDKVTKWFRENIRDVFQDDPCVLMATVIFRWFNKIETGELLLKEGLLVDWNEEDAIRLLKEQNRSKPVFTGAYMIKCGNGPPGCKIPMVCSAISQVWNEKDLLYAHIRGGMKNTLQSAHKSLCTFRGLGGFMSYEIVTDLRHTHILNRASDIDTWANPGPGCLRGLSWLEYGHENGKVSQPIDKMRELLKVIRMRLSTMPKFELREVEHSLCEADKYNRALFGTGKMKRRYQGV